MRRAAVLFPLSRIPAQGQAAAAPKKPGVEERLAKMKGSLSLVDEQKAKAAQPKKERAEKKKQKAQQ